MPIGFSGNVLEVVSCIRNGARRTRAETTAEDEVVC